MKKKVRSIRSRGISAGTLSPRCRGLVRLTVFLVLLMCAHFHIQRACAVEQPNEAAENIEQRVRETVTKLLKDLELYGLEQAGEEKRIVITSIENDQPTNNKIAACKVGDIKINVEVDGLRVVRLKDRSLLFKLIKDIHVHSDTDNSTRTYEQMEKLARELINKHFGGLPDNVVVDRIKSDGDAEVTFGDVWGIRWTRKTGKYLYPHDIILLDISEKHGILSYSNSVSSCEVDTSINLSKEKAVAIAKRKLALAVSQYNKHEVQAYDLEKIKDYDYERVSLRADRAYGVKEALDRPTIVNVGYVGPWDCIQPKPSEARNKAVLVWPVTFSSLKNGDFALYISTRDGSYIGYNYFFPKEIEGKRE